ncbi:structural maintenance of chromosomes protein 6-like isoform X2 [Apostichopus japonicus]|uniref:structural maintenance of chromosomes protein 6-like isoform X2 n=1 Tax=Stichopus japonicus TaxID=307972 RepID=UPI003AB24D0D
MDKRKFVEDGATPKAKRIHVKASSSQRSSADESGLDSSQLHDLSSLGNNADHGIIDRIYLKNFMCHGKLEFNFGPNVNFVVGRNGSGKSAIMTALVVGLGGKASVTSRGSSLKNFIKDGKNVAEISIILRNEGTDAYKSELYGPRIRIERRITSDGATSYKLKSHKGHVVSNKREELTRIMDQFNIQVDNPVSILNQDTSRNFLFTKDPRDKYKFFMKATQLEQIESHYALIQEQKTITEDKISMKEEGLPDLEKDALEKEQRFKDIESLNTLREKREKLLKVLAWAHVTEIEQELDVIAKSLTQEENRLPKFETKVEESQVKVSEAEGKVNEVKQKITELTKQMEEIQPQLDVAKGLSAQSRKYVKDLEKQIRSIQQSEARDRHDMKDCQRKIEELKQSAQRDYDKERLEREEKMAILLKEKEEREARFATTENDFRQFTEAVERTRQRNYELRAKLQDLKNSVDQRQRRIEDLEKSRSNRIRLFGNFVPALVAEIKKQRNFHRVPKGPVGMYLKVKQIKWALGVECILKGLMFNFCCHDHHDATILKKLMAQVAPKGARMPGIIISTFEERKHDINSGMIHGSNHPSFLDLVEVDDPVIFNCLIDQRAVERILLVESKEEARNYLRFSPPQNCREAFTLEGDQVYAGSEQRYYSSMKTKARVMQADVAQGISDTKAELANLRQEKAEGDRELHELQLERENNERHSRRLNDQRRQLRKEIGQLEDEIQELESVEDSAPVDVSALEEEVHQLQEQLENKRQECTAKKEELGKCNQEFANNKAEFERLQNQLMEYADQVEPFKHELHTNGLQVERAKHERKHYEGKKREQMAKIDELKKRMSKKEEDVAKDTEKAKQISKDRIKTKRKPQNIDNELRQMTTRIDKEQERRGDPAEITREYDRAKESYEEARRQIEKLKSIIKILDEMLQVRKAGHLQIRASTSANFRMRFIDLMHIRKMECKLRVNHQNETIDFEVQPTEGHKQSKSKDMRALSGGERSFSTVCFIMALWESMDAPFRALDEFDVFMDMINRKIVMELLLQVAKDLRHRQFIFLTPQDMSKITASPLVRIVRLNDPERNQSTLPFRRRNDTEEENGD